MVDGLYIHCKGDNGLIFWFLFFFPHRIVLKITRSIWPWTQDVGPRMCYGAIFMRPRVPLCTVTFVTSIYVQPVWGNTSQISNCDLKIGDLLLSAKNIPLNNVNCFVNNMTFQFVNSVFPLKSIEDINFSTWWKNMTT